MPSRGPAPSFLGSQEAQEPRVGRAMKSSPRLRGREILGRGVAGWNKLVFSGVASGRYGPFAPWVQLGEHARPDVPPSPGAQAAPGGPRENGAFSETQFSG